jgi:hypothetical protein
MGHPDLRRRGGLHLRGGVLFARKEQGEDGAAMARTVAGADAEDTLMPVDDACGDPEAEASAVQILRGKERFEDAADGRLVHTVSGVGDGDANAGSKNIGGTEVGFVCADDQASPRAHRIDCVRDQIVENLADVIFEAKNSSLGEIFCVDPDIGVGEPARVESDDRVDEFRRRDLGWGDSLAVEAKRLSRNLRDTRELRLRHVDVNPQGVGKRLIELNQIQEIGNGFERIVDLVRDGAREATDGSQLFALDEGGFGALLIRDLDGCRRDGSDAPVLVEDGRVVDTPEAALAGAWGEFALKKVIADRDAGGCGPHEFEDVRDLVRCRDFGERFAQKYFSWCPEHLGFEFVEVEEG